MESISASLGMINVKERHIYLEGTVLEQVLWAGWENVWPEQKLSPQKEKERETIFHTQQRMQEDQGPFCLLQENCVKKKKRKYFHSRFQSPVALFVFISG